MPELRTAILDIVVFFCSYILAPLKLIINRQIQVCLTELYSHPTQKSRFPHKLPLPAHICKSSYNGGSGFLCSYRRVFVPLPKSRFFVIYFRGVTLADGIDCCPVRLACIKAAVLIYSYAIFLLRNRFNPSRKTMMHTAEPVTKFIMRISVFVMPSNDTSIDLCSE